MFQFKNEEKIKHHSELSVPKRQHDTKIVKTQLWHFLLERLSDSDANSSIITWEGGYGEFRIVNPETLAKMWGEKSGRPKMSYQTMSRALRHYYAKGILSKVKHKKWCYCFSQEALEMAIGNGLVLGSLPYSLPVTRYHPRPEYYQPYSFNHDYMSMNSKSFFPNSWSFDMLQFQQEALGFLLHENVNMPPPFSPGMAYF